MEDIIGTLLAIGQLILFGFTALGWGLWIGKLVGGNLRARLADQALCMIAGWAAYPLLLSNFVYFGVKISWSAWIGLGVAIAGWAYFFYSQPRQTWYSWIQGNAHAGIIGVLVILFQGAGLWTNGAHNYYGSAHQDHVNYVQLAEFLIEKPFNTSLNEVGLEPWQIKAIDVKEMRIGQSVANAYIAVVSGSDAKSAYGAVSIFSVGLMAVAVFGLLRNLGLSHISACLAAFWAGTLPIITRTHLDGFFSQTFVLGTLPALAWATLVAARHTRLSLLTSGLILAQLLNSYTEIFVIGIAIVASGLLVRIEISPLRRMALIACIFGFSVAAVPSYSLRCFAFIEHQFKVATNPEALADLAPRAGTWSGWTELYFPSGVTIAQAVPMHIMLAGFLVLALVLVGLSSAQPIRRLWLLSIAAVPAAIFAVLLSLPVFSKYPFAKLLATFSPLFIVLASLGLWRTLLLSTTLWGPRLITLTQSRRIRALGYISACSFVVASGWGSVQMLGAIIRNEGILTIVNSAQTRSLYQQLEANPGRAYLLNEQHNILNAWLAYHARHSKLYADVNFIGDRPTPSSSFAFRRPPPEMDLALLNRNGIKSIRLTRGAPDILVRNPQGIEGSQESTFYWIGDNAEIEFYHFSPKPEDFVFTLRGLAGPANPSLQRVIALTPSEPGSQPIVISFVSDAKLIFPIHLRPGRNSFTFTVIEPTEWIVRIPSDARKHMVRIQELSLTSAAPPNG